MNLKEIIDMNIDYSNNKIIFISKDNIIERNLTDFFKKDTESFEFLDNSDQFNYNSIQTIKKEILAELRELLIVSMSDSAFKQRFSNIKKDHIKEEIISIFRENSERLKFIKDFCYTDSKTKAKNELYFKRYFSKEDFDFNTYTELDDYNEMLNDFNSSMYNTVLCCEINNLSVINTLSGEGAGDRIIEVFTNDVFSLFNDVSIIRYGGDEFLILTNDDTASGIIDLITGEGFISTLNNELPSLSKDGVNIFATISYGRQDLYFPASIYSRDEIIDFKKDFNLAYYVAQNELSLKKQSIKDKYGHTDLKKNFINHSQIAEYHSHLHSKLDENHLDAASSLIESFGNSPVKVDINSFARKIV